MGRLDVRKNTVVLYQPRKNLPFRPIEDLDFPREVQIQTHTACNARCIMCPYEDIFKKVGHGRMRRELFERLIDECAGHEVWDLKPFLMNEPLLDRRLPSLVRYARERLPNTIIGFSTNGQLLEGPLAEELVDSGLDEIWVNFNGNTRTTYETIMRGLSFERVRRNVLDFKQLVVQKRANVCIFISTVETQLAVAEIEASRAFWRQYDIPVVKTPLNNRGGNLQTNGLQVLRSIKGHRVCDRPFYNMYIAYNGDAILCSSDCERLMVIGNVEVDGLQRVWNSDRQKWVRKWILAREWGKLSLCRSCDYIAIYD